MHKYLENTYAFVLNGDMNTFAKSLDTRGISVREAALKPGCKYQTVYKRYTGDRNVSAMAALICEQALGIPRSELCPDLMPTPDGARA